MAARLGSLPRALRYGAAALAAAVLAWGVALPLAFEPLVRWAAERATASWAGHRIEVAAARWSPWRLAAGIDGLVLRGPKGDELAAVQRLEVDLAAAGLLRRAWTLDALRLEGPRLAFALAADGRSNWSALLQALQPPRPPAAGPATELPRLRIEALRLTGGRLLWIDRRGGIERRHELDAVEFALDELSTLPDDRGTHQLAARSTLGGTLRWDGRLGLAPLQAQGRVEVEGIDLARLWALLPQPPLRTAPPAGRASAALAYEFDPQGWRLDGVRLQLDGLALQGEQGAGAALRLDRIALDGGRIDGQRRELAFATLRIEGGRVQAARDGQGRIDLLDWLPPARAEPAAATPTATLPSAAAPRVSSPASAPPAVAPPAVAPPAVALPAVALPAVALPAVALPAVVSSAASPSVASPSAATASPGPALPAAAPAAAPSAAPAKAWALKLERLAVERVALDFEDRAWAQPLRVRSAGAALTLGASARLGDAAPALALRDLGLQLDGLELASGGAAPWLALDALQLAGGTLDLASRRAGAARLQLRGGRLALARERDGGLALARAFAPKAAAAQAPDSKASTGAAAAAPKAAPKVAARATAAATPPAAAPWQLDLQALQLEGWQTAWTDASVAPAARLGLVDLQLELRDLGTDLRRPVAVRAGARVASGGRVALQGSVTPQAGAAATPRAELQLRVDGLALAAAQPYLEALTVLRLARGEARTAGRLRWQGSDWSYAGSAGLSGLRIEIAGRDEPFLQLARLDAPRLALTPARIDLGNLQLDGLAAELIIDRERRINLAQLGRGPAAGTAAAAAAAASTAAPAPPAPSARSAAPAAPAPSATPAPTTSAAAAARAPAPADANPLPRIVLDRLRLVDARLDFADLSLALPFAARIEQLNGEIAGLDSGAGAAPAQVELAGRVAPDGLARARGSLQPLAPAAFSDVQVTFRNVEMTTLTPYTATFAGRRIASGRLSLDLDYKLRERRLQGDNRVVMERLVLGERVDSPSATSLPLDLAVALLQDADGRIDLGLPVSGSLDDPQFSYGALVWKVIVNVLTRVVTAPFRALGALLGGNEALADGIGRISFDAGRAALLPPEREKLGRLATTLAQRPGLALQLPAATAAADREALRELQLRRALAALEGRTLGPDGDPGPLALQLPATQAALEPRFVQRVGAPALAQVRAQAQPAAAPAATVAGTPAATAAAPAAPVPPAGPAETLWQRLLQAEPVDDAALAALGEARRAAMTEALRAAGLDPARVRAGGSGQAEAAAGSVVVGLALAPAAAARVQ
ncbi:MAG: DUF748 domain-containing protein [Pseudomonadota bacterium]